MGRDDLLRVKHIKVVKLFGKYSHEVPLSEEDRVTIIHGPNGVGKTVLFRLVAALLSGNIFELLKVPFDKFEVTLSDGSVLGILRSAYSEKRRKTSDKQKEDDPLIASFYLLRDGKEVNRLPITFSQGDSRRLTGRIEREMPWVRQIDEDRFIDRRTDEVFGIGDLPMYYVKYANEMGNQRSLFPTAEWLSDISDRVNVHLVETQRLLSVLQRPPREWEPVRQRSSSQYIETVKSYAKDLQSRISQTLTLYAKQSQSLDQSFPQRLLKSPYIALPVDSLKTRMKELEDYRKPLKRMGLIAEDSTYPFDVRELEKLDATQRTVMTLYVEDTESKLGVLDDLARRIGILIENINNKFANKSILIDREKGLIARTDDNKILELDALSSGEQHELVLLYDLLFRVKPNTLVLIDEPELSLHVTWQKSFLPDLIKVVEATGCDVLLATHSPFIVGDRDDLMVPLSAESLVKSSSN
jgi:predicted ATPase